MSSSKGLKRADNVSIVNPLVMETLEKLIEKSKPISSLNFDNDIDNLEIQLGRAEKLTKESGGGILVITEGVFGMSGNMGDLVSIIGLKEKFNFA